MHWSRPLQNAVADLTKIASNLTREPGKAVHTALRLLGEENWSASAGEPDNLVGFSAADTCIDNRMSASNEYHQSQC
jgi:hypothetical protein